MDHRLHSLWKTEDWWAIWFGLGIVLLALLAFAAGGSIRGWAVTPRTWSDLEGLAVDTPGIWSATPSSSSSSDWFQCRLSTAVISPVKKLRSWAFVLCFLGIGLSTRFAELATFGLRPFWAFTIGVLVNVPLGYVLSTVVFSSYWTQI